MENTPSSAPIASPHGEGAVPIALRHDEKYARVAVERRPQEILRYSLSEWLMPLTLSLILFFPAVGALVLFPVGVRRFGLATLPLAFAVVFVALVLFSAPFALCVRLCFRRHFEIWISQNGLTKHYPNRDIFFAWNKFIWLLNLKSDLWFASFSDGCFIPRDSFASREEAHEFAAIARELKQSNGAAWRDQWNGRVFGVQPDEGEGALNIPR